MRHSRRFASWLAFAVLGLSVSVCTDSDISPRGAAKPVTFSIAPVFSASATTALQAFRASGIQLDRARVTIVRPPSEVLAEEEILLAGRGAQFTREYTVSARVGEILTARLEFRAGTATLFAGSGSVTARAADDAS